MEKRINKFAKKSLGQNFLSDPKILAKIADAAEIKKDDVVVEIGPGRGSLTEFLIEKAGKVIVVEKDEELAKNLNGENLEIITGDILEINQEIIPKNYILVGNIPYYITGEIFRKFLESENQPKSMTFVVQKEVADRIMARNNKESVLSISIKAYGSPEYGGIIKKGSFNPMPKVDSGIISIRNINKSRFSNKNAEIDEKRFFQIVKSGFAHKRKLLIKNLEIILDKTALEHGFDSLNIDKNARAEDLSIEKWFEIAQIK